MEDITVFQSVQADAEPGGARGAKTPGAPSARPLAEPGRAPGSTQLVSLL